MSMLDKFGNRFANNSSAKDVFYKFKPGVNRIRLVGDMVEARAHYLAGNAKRGNRGLCPQISFEGDDKIFTGMNCLDWDAATEAKKPVRTCPICQLHQIAGRALSSGKLNDSSKAFYEELKNNSREMTSFKVNIIDRDDPFITVSEDGVERRVKGLKIASLTYTVAKTIFDLAMRFGFGLEHPEKGIDLEVTRTDTNGKTSYTVQPAYKPKSTDILVTPLTEEERNYTVHNLVEVCGRGIDPLKIRAALHGDLTALLDKYYPLPNAGATPPVVTPEVVADVVTTSTTSAVESNTLDEITAQSMSEASEETSVLDKFPQTNTLGAEEDIFPF